MLYKLHFSKCPDLFISGADIMVEVNFLILRSVVK